MLDSMLDGVETEVITTGVITSPENEEVMTTGNAKQGEKTWLSQS